MIMKSGGVEGEKPQAIHNQQSIAKPSKAVLNRDEIRNSFEASYKDKINKIR